MWYFIVSLILLSIHPVKSNKNCLKPGCNSCISGFSYKNTSCLSICPSSYQEIGKTCEPSESFLLFDLEFFNFLNFSASSFNSFHHPLNLMFLDESKQGPLPTKTQGFYFEPSSSLVSSASWTLAPDFCFTIFFKSFKSGRVFTISENSTIFLQILSKDSEVEIWLNTSNNESHSMQKTKYLSPRFWTTFSFRCIQSKFHLILTNNYENIPLIGSEFQMPSKSSTFRFGSSFEKKIEGFQGFLYYFCMKNDLSCYYKTLSAPSCDLFSYVELSCKTCDPNCRTWPFCTRKTCNFCYSASCLECSGYGSEHCTLCADSSLDQCIEARNCAKGSGFKCQECLPNFVLVEGLCLRPYSKFLPLNVKFDKIQQFAGGVFQSGANASTFAPFNQAEKDDPVPLKQRGYFFDAGTFMMTKQLNLNYKFSIFTWISIKNYVNVIQTELISMFFDGITRIRLRNFEEFRLFIVNNDCVVEDWKIMGVVLDYQDGTSYLHSVCNSKVALKVQARGYAFYDFNSFFNITASNYFFLYQLVILPFSDFQYSKFFDTCPTFLDFSCLWRPEKTLYFNQAFQQYESCSSDCKDGCSTFATCHQCKFLDCSVCDDFYQNCSSGPDGKFRSCLEGFQVSDDRLKCCDFRCADCYADRHFYCLSCRTGFYLDRHVCMTECPTEFQYNGNKCDPPKDFIVFSSIFNKKVKNLRSKSISFQLGNSSAVLTKGRGLFFSEGSKLSSNDFLMSSAFSLMIWIRVKKHGKIMQKDSFFINSSVFVEFLNNSLKFPPLISDTWNLMVFNFYESAGVYFVVLKSLFGLFSTSSLMRSCFEDTKSSLVLGSEGFSGFVWKVSLFSKENMNGTQFDVCSDKIAENCLWDCDLFEYFDGNTCRNRSDYCDFKWPTGFDCNLCTDPRCVDSQVFIGKCECTDGYFWNGEKCQECEEVSSRGRNEKCSRCAKGANQTTTCQELKETWQSCPSTYLEGSTVPKSCTFLKTAKENSSETSQTSPSQDQPFLVICSEVSFLLLSQSFSTPNFLNLKALKPKLYLYLASSSAFCDYFFEISHSDLSSYSKNPKNFFSHLRIFNHSSTKMSSLNKNSSLSRDDFEFIKIIGRGAYGEVWEVKLRKTGKNFALKLVPKSRLWKSNKILSSKRERDLMTQLFSRFLVNLHFSFQDPLYLYLGLDLMKGGSLRFHMLNSERITEDQAKFIIGSILLGLDYIHNKNIIHQDIKPDNLLFDLKGEVFITDFGLSIPASSSNDSLNAGGTTGYLSPEVAFKKNRTFTSDYFSVGVILHEIIFQSKPFKGKSSEYYQELKTVNPKNLESPKNWTFEAVDFCYKMIEKNPELRLGNLGFEQVKNHPWVRRFLWDDLKYGKIQPPFVPVDRVNFDLDDMSVWSEHTNDVDFKMITETFQDFYFEREDLK